MLEYQQKRNIRKMVYSKWMILLLLVALIFMTKSSWGAYQKSQLSKENLDRVVNEYNDLSSREQTLSTDVERLKTEKGIEEEIRGKFTVVKDGEQIAIIVDDKTATITASTTPKESWWGNFVKIFR